MAKAVRVYHAREVFADGTIMEITLGRLPVRTAERPHGLKYSLFFRAPGERWVGYDNERGKSDHKHIRGVETPYTFIDIDRLFDDFMADVAQTKKSG
jgi:hypothetical protein